MWRRGQLKTFHAPATLLPGIRAVPLRGHTPGRGLSLDPIALAVEALTLSLSLSEIQNPILLSNQTTVLFENDVSVRLPWLVRVKS